MAFRSNYNLLYRASCKGKVFRVGRYTQTPQHETEKQEPIYFHVVIMGTNIGNPINLLTKMHVP